MRTKSKKNRIIMAGIGFFLAVCMLLPTLTWIPAPAYDAACRLNYDTAAADAGFYSMGTGGSQLVGGQKSKFTMGTCGEAPYLTADGIPWLVLDVNETEGKALVLSEYLIDNVGPYTLEWRYPKGAFWSNSYLRSYLNGGQGCGKNPIISVEDSFYGSSFSEADKQAVRTSTIVTQKFIHENSRMIVDSGSRLSNYVEGNNVYKYMPNSAAPAPAGMETESAYADGKETTVDKVFLLDYNDVARGWPNAPSNAAKYGFDETAQEENGATSAHESRKAYLARSSVIVDAWWLRGSGLMGGAYGIYVDHSGKLGFAGGKQPWSFRPAFHIDLDSIVLTTSAADGKADTVGDRLHSTAAAAKPSDFKLTLKDETRADFRITAERTADGKRQFDYAGAQTCENEYISAIIKRNGNVVYYGKLAQSNSESGTAEMTLPADMRESDEIYVFNERATDAKTPDLSSPLQKASAFIDKPIEKPTAEATYDGSSRAPFAASTGYTVINEKKTADGAYERIAGEPEAAGEYRTTVALTDGYYWKDNTREPIAMEWTIAKADYDLTGVTFADESFVYDGQAHSLELRFGGDRTGLPTGADGIPLTVSYRGEATDVGQGTVTATFATESGNYNVPAPLTAEVSITPREVTVVWTGEATHSADRPPTPQANIAADAFITGDDVQLSVTGLDKTAPGDYTATATLTGAQAGNYRLTNAEYKFTIPAPAYPLWQVIVTGISLLILLICAIVAITGAGKARGYKRRIQRAETRLRSNALLPIVLAGVPLIGTVTEWTYAAIATAIAAVCAAAGTGVFCAYVRKLRSICEEAEAAAENAPQTSAGESSMMNETKGASEDQENTNKGAPLATQDKERGLTKQVEEGNSAPSSDASI